jgi:hypothetical protein
MNIQAKLLQVSIHDYKRINNNMICVARFKVKKKSREESLL